MEKKQRRWKWIAAATAVAASLLALFVAELGLRFYDGPRLVVTYTIQRNSAYFSPELDDKSPLYYAYSGIESVDATQVTVHYPDGKQRAFRYSKPADTFRVVAVGDSINELWNLSGYVNYTTFLEAGINELLRTSNSEVIPLGVGGYNTWQEMHFYKQHFQALEADVLLLQWCPNDGDVMSLRPRPASQQAPGNEWPRYEIVGRRFGRPDFDRFRIGPFQSRIWWLLAGWAGPSHELDRYVQVASSDEQRQAIAWFRDLARTKRMPLLVVLFPMFVDGYSQPELKHVKSLLDDAGVGYLDLLPAFQEAGSLSSAARDSYHPNDKGHELAAQAIRRHLEDQKYLVAHPIGQ